LLNPFPLGPNSGLLAPFLQQYRSQLLTADALEIGTVLDFRNGFFLHSRIAIWGLRCCVTSSVRWQSSWLGRCTRGCYWGFTMLLWLKPQLLTADYWCVGKEVLCFAICLHPSAATLNSATHPKLCHRTTEGLAFASHLHRLRVGFNSIGAGASVNHLHFQFWTVKLGLPVESAPRELVIVNNDDSEVRCPPPLLSNQSSQRISEC
jgi:hypothetical protein